MRLIRQVKSYFGHWANTNLFDYATPSFQTRTYIDEVSTMTRRQRTRSVAWMSGPVKRSVERRRSIPTISTFPRPDEHTHSLTTLSMPFKAQAEVNKN